MGKFTSHNLSVISRRVNKKTVSNAFTNQMVSGLTGIAEWIMRNAYDEIPVDTWNLLEGTGIGIYANGVLTAFRYDELATQPRDGQWGRNTLTKALTAGSARFSQGLWIVAFSTTSYAEKVNEWDGFFSEAFVSEMEGLVLSQFKLK